jgi:hypothetical protein
MYNKITVPLIFALLIIFMTFPLVISLTTHIPGFFSTDEPYAAIWNSWRIEYSVQNNLSLKSTTLIAYPFGMELYTSGYFSYLWMGLIYFLSIITTPILTYNLQIFFNFFLSAIFIYLLVFYLTKNRLSAILSGIIFAFCPYQFARTWQHLGLTYNQWIPLCLFAAILLKENSKKSTVIFLLSLLLAFSFDWSIMYFTTIMLASFCAYLLLYNWKLKLFKQRNLIVADFRYFKRVFFVGIIVFIILHSQFLAVMKNRLRFSSATPASVFNPYHRQFKDLFSQSAKPLSYLLPATMHPIFGKFTEQFIGSSLYGVSFTEHTLYLGWIPLILSFLAFRKWRRKRKLQAIVYQPSAENFYIGFFVFLAIVAWLFSQPPWWKIGPIKIYMPSFFMYKILPMYRAYCRFGIVVMLAVAVLAGFGLKSILEKFKSNFMKTTIACLFSILVLFEFWNWPPYKIIDVSKVPAVYGWIKEQPGDFVIAEYPLDAASPNEMYKIYQTKHEKKIINGTIPGTYPNQVARTIVRLSEPNTTGVLKWMGVKYVLVHKQDYLKTELIDDKEDLEKIPYSPGLKFIKSFPEQDCPNPDIMCVQKTGPIDVYEVIALPIKPEIQ